MKRAVIFFLAASSIACLLLEFYVPGTMRWFTPCVFIPAMIVLLVVMWRDKQLWRLAGIGAVAGLAATVAYDVFRVPFVVWVGMPFFKVFPQFGARILGGSANTPAAQVVGWIYHFSNGITFGVMYAALVGWAFRRKWPVAVVFAVGLETAMLLTPYTTRFGISLTPRFVAVTLTAHLVFGVTMGLTARWLDGKRSN